MDSYQKLDKSKSIAARDFDEYIDTLKKDFCDSIARKEDEITKLKASAERYEDERKLFVQRHNVVLGERDACCDIYKRQERQIKKLREELNEARLQRAAMTDLLQAEKAKSKEQMAEVQRSWKEQIERTKEQYRALFSEYRTELLVLADRLGGVASKPAVEIIEVDEQPSMANYFLLHGGTV